MTKLFKPLISWWRLFRKTKSLQMAYKLLPEVYTPVIDEKSVKRKFSNHQVELFGSHGELLLKYLKATSVTFVESVNKFELVSIAINEKKILLQTVNYDNLRVIEEIFIDRLYDFHVNGQYIVIDVGMNIAAASLYFASFENVEKVYGYEPFPRTFQRAKQNIALNTSLEHKIEAFDFGLGKQDEELTVPAPSDGFLGGSTSADFINELPESMKTGSITVQIKDAAGTLKQLAAKHPGNKILLKLDCEGAEYEIMEELAKQSLIDMVSIFMIEFHFKGKKAILDLLKAHGYLVTSPVSDEVNLFGMLYAYKVNG